MERTSDQWREAFADYHSTDEASRQTMLEQWDNMPEAERQEHIEGLEDW